MNYRGLLVTMLLLMKCSYEPVIRSGDCADHLPWASTTVVKYATGYVMVRIDLSMPCKSALVSIDLDLR